MRKAVLAVLLFASPVFAQDPAPTTSAGGGCGPNEAQFDVKTNRNVKLEPVESAEGQFLISASSFSTYHPKK